MKLEERTELQSSCTVEKGEHDQTLPQNPMLDIVAFTDTVTPIEVFMVGFFVIAGRATIRMTHHI